MGSEDETNRTLFIRNLDQRVTEELLFELFLQAGPLIKTKIPKHTDGKQKTFGFVMYKHEESVPYALKLLEGTSLYDRTIYIQFKSGSSHDNSSGNSQNSSPASTPSPHGPRTQVQLNSSPYAPPPLMQKSFSSSENLQKQILMTNLMWQQQMQQLQQLNAGLTGMQPRQQPVSGSSTGGGSRQYNNSYRQMSSGGGSDHNRNQRHTDDLNPGRRQQHSHSHSRDNFYNHDNRGGNRHQNRGGDRKYDDRSGNRGYQDRRWRRY
ncbi:RNA-binding protein 7 [Lampris incognitus]|uniref:RNA-binding protein 7 n=1 Tax=Lampris incognitus TaxID=2546036 RepID=UPI0024B4CE10|nr:RNA-binding protein 7 [Lampris incognitus]